VRFDDDDAIDVDETIDQLTELIFIPTHSLAREVQNAIVLPVRKEAAPKLHKSKSPRPSLIILPDDVATLGAAPESPPARKTTKRAHPRAMQLSPFAVSARPSGRS